MTEQETKDAAEPPLDCLVGLRMAIENVMRHQFTGSREAMTALQELVDVAEVAKADIERMSETLRGIINADWRKWEELARPEEFVRWAKARANHALQVPNARGEPGGTNPSRADGA